MEVQAETVAPRLARVMPGWERRSTPLAPWRIGVLAGEGIGPEVVAASLSLLEVIEAATGHRFDVRYGGKIGLEAQRASGQVLTDEVVRFCEDTFVAQGAVFCGPGGGRFVYELRRHFNLYCKMVPLQPLAALAGTGVLRPEAVREVDILVVRENAGGLYQGHFGFEQHGDQRRAFQHFHYDEAEVARILHVAREVARLRRRRVCVITKPGGAPAISRLWQEQAERLFAGTGIEVRSLEVDTASYQLLAAAQTFDVVVAPNMFGDVLADGATLLLGSRGVSCSSNYGIDGRAVYQTGHGAAYDLAGTDRANPIGQILSLAMLLHESFALDGLAAAIRAAVEDTLARGWRTADILAPGCREVGTRELAARIGERLLERLRHTPASQAVGR
jgi:3-isopropylmalate dehydrogenase